MSGALFSFAALWTLVAGVSAAETDTTAAPRTAAGKPDLDGLWDFSTPVPLERPEEVGDRALLTDEEAAEVEARAANAPRGVWSEETAGLSGDRRTSLISDPPNGRLPATRPGVVVQRPEEALAVSAPVRIKVGGIGTDGPENRGLSERCLLGFNAGPPIVPGFYNQNLRIVQSDDHVVLLTEMIHDARIVPLADSPAVEPLPQPRRWMGTSVGYWDGDTLVVETLGWKDQVGSFSPTPFAATGSARDMHLTERLRRLDRDRLRYEFTVDDPATWERPFTGVLLLKRSTQRIYEYACHEGNYPLRHILQAARALEKEVPP